MSIFDEINERNQRIALQRQAQNAALKAERISRLRQQETGDYINAAEAAQEIGMSPMRFLALLRRERERLPIERNV